MKNDDAATRPKHLTTDHAPTVIHDPHEDETILARWLRQGLEHGPRFWILLGLGLVAIIGAWLAAQFLTGRESTESQAWRELILATDTETRSTLGQSADGPPACWALIQAAETRYQEGYQNFPQSRQAGLEKLKAAYDLFRQAYRKAGQGTPERYFAGLGMARTLETRGEIDEALKQYDEIAKAYAGSPMGDRAAKLAETLRQPESRAYYQEFTAFTPTQAALPPGATRSIDLNSLPGLTAPTAPLPPVDAPPLAPPTDAPAPASNPVDLSAPPVAAPASDTPAPAPATPPATP